MAIARTGISAGINPGTGNTGSFDITVPAGTNCLIVYVTGYNAVTNIFTDTGAGVTCETAAADAVVTAADANSTSYAGAGWVFLNPPIGAGVTIAWDWKGTDTMDYAPMFTWVAYSGVGSIRQATGNQAAALQYTTGALTTVANDLLSIAVFGYHDQPYEASVTTWSVSVSDETEFAQINVNYSDMTLADFLATGTSTTVATTAAVRYEDGGIMAVIMVPEAGGLSILQLAQSLGGNANVMTA